MSVKEKKKTIGNEKRRICAEIYRKMENFIAKKNHNEHSKQKLSESKARWHRNEIVQIIIFLFIFKYLIYFFFFFFYFEMVGMLKMMFIQWINVWNGTFRMKLCQGLNQAERIARSLCHNGRTKIQRKRETNKRNSDFGKDFIFSYSLANRYVSFISFFFSSFSCHFS